MLTEHYKDGGSDGRELVVQKAAFIAIKEPEQGKESMNRVMNRPYKREGKERQWTVTVMFWLAALTGYPVPQVCRLRRPRDKSLHELACCFRFKARIEWRIKTLPHYKHIWYTIYITISKGFLKNLQIILQHVLMGDMILQRIKQLQIWSKRMNKTLVCIFPCLSVALFSSIINSWQLNS